MTELHPLRELVWMRLRTFLREPEALFWTFGFPVILAIGLGLAFGDPPRVVAEVAVERGSSAERWTRTLRASPELRVRVLPPDSAARALRTGEVAVVLRGRDTLTFQYDPGREESLAARLLADQAVQRAAGGTRPVAVREDRERRRGARYIDWVIPGLIGLNLMSTGMWGIGFGVVQMRQKKQLKRLVSTPMRRRDYLLAQILSRLVFVALEVPPIVLFAYLAFGVRVEGGWAALAVVVLTGAMAFAGMGLLAASRARTIEGVSGLLNLAMLPMFVLSGVFFSARRYPESLQPLVQALPLTALNDALRGVYGEGAPLPALGGELLILAAWMAASFFLALRWFRWQ
jgi:ABC-2 type transport system permease protein